MAILPIRVGLQVADAVLQAVAPAPPARSGLVVVDGMPEGVPAAALRPEPRRSRWVEACWREGRRLLSPQGPTSFVLNASFSVATR